MDDLTMDDLTMDDLTMDDLALLVALHTPRAPINGYCPHCGIELIGGEKFCPNCGQMIGEVEETDD